MNNKNDEFESKTDKYNIGTPGYIAPEIIINKYSKSINEKIDLSNIKINKSCDIFSLSIILWKMLNGIKSEPFKIAYKTDEKYKLIIDQNYTKFWDNHKDCIFMKYKDERELIKDLFNKMFEFDPKERITIDQILKHKFILNCNNDNSITNNYNDNGFKIFMRNVYNKSRFIRNKKINVLKQYQANTITTISQMVCLICYIN